MKKQPGSSFGDIQAVGKEISCEGNSYIVRNVVSGKEGIIAFQASKILVEKSGKAERAESNQPIDGTMQRVTIQKPEGYSVHDLESAWNNTYGLFGDVLDIELLRGIGGFCMLLFPVSLCVCFWIYLYHQCIFFDDTLWIFGRLTKNRKVFQGKAAAIGLSLVLAVMLMFFLKGQVKIPDDYIPTRWSEFSFWTTLWETKREAVKLLFEMPKSELDAGWVGNFFQTVVCGLLAEALLLIDGLLVKYRKNLSVRDIMVSG